MASKAKDNKAILPADENTIQNAVEEGRKLIAVGKPKIEAAMAIYQRLEGMDQEVIVKAFVTGASLTEKGAVTYWYNCRRRLARERRSPGR